MNELRETRRYVVTGVSRGIGRAIASRLLEGGCEVIGTYRSGRDGARQLAQANPGLSLHQVDLGDPAEVGRFIEALGSVPLDGLVNNAGMIHFESDSFEVEAWRETLEVNLMAPVRLSRELAGQFRPEASVVNIASVDGTVGSYNSMAYAASKAALLNATQGLANLLGERGFRVNAVTPGWIATDMADEHELIRSITPLNRLGEPGEVADTVAWLLGPESSFVSGASIVVDGGMSNVDVVLKKEWESRGE